MKMALLLQLIPAFLFSLAAASAQNISDPKPQQAADALLDHRVWREEHGLPVDRIKDIIQTRDGYLWLGTSHGLARFDGVRFTVFNRANTSAFRADDCWILVEGEEGALWIATPHGLITYSKGHFRGFGAEDGLTDDFIGAMTYGHKTGLWVGTGAGLSRYQHGHWTTYRISDGVLTAPVLRLHEDHAGRIWVGTVKGLQILDPATSRFSADLPQHPYSSNNVFGIHTDADGTAWILYFDRDNSSFHLMRFKNGEALELPMPFVNLDGYRLTVSSQSILGFLRVSERWPMEEWFAKDAPHQLILPVPPHDVIISHLEDHEGGLWVGTRNSGLHRFRVEPKPISRLLDGLPSGMTWTVAQDEHGILWAGTDKGLARCADGKVTTFGIQGGLSDEYVRSLSFDKQGRLWVGSADGLDVFENGRLRSVSFPGTGLERKVRAVLWARDDSLWLGTDGGVFRQSSGNWTSLTATNGLGDNRAPLLLEDGAGDVWIGTVAGGLHRWRAGQVARFTSNDGLASDRISSLSLDSHGTLWVGTDLGISRLEDDKFRMVVTTNESPISTPVRSIIEDDFGYFWIYCAGGVFGALRDDLVHPRRKPAEQFITRINLGEWNPQPAVPKSQPTGWKTHDGRILFATLDGVLSIDPLRFRRRQPPPPVLIEQVVANGETVYANSPIGFDGQSTPSRAATPSPLKLLPGYGRHLELHFTDNTFAGSERLRFKYKLEGADTDWVNAGKRRSAHYNTLKPGEYIFHVMACDDFQDWNESISRLPIHLAARVHETGWFQALMGLVIALALVGIIRWRWAELRKMQALERQVALTNERTRLARDLHDQLGSEVTRAMRLSEQLDAAKPHAAPGPQRLQESLRTMRQRIDAAVWAIAPDKDHVGSFVDFAADRAQSLLEGTGVELDLDLPEHGLERSLPPENRHELVMVVLEAVNNALRHAQARRVQLAFNIQANTLRIEIADDGCGFNPEGVTSAQDAMMKPLSKPSSSDQGRTTAAPRLARNGIAGMHARVQRLGGTVAVDSQPGGGTRILVQVALRCGKSA